ncbi:DUF3515 domain-containing protein [uncultured Corynebacterium sp.]|uniref:DUF3515 domain-containing protein n=1 Tax=uncultured Corynebacterium sp. TaxID=159447 RepID=UPI0025E38B3D|nr:DUF3515 domain-containing protein [uncultured Corynebacterium sp.]
MTSQFNRTAIFISLGLSIVMVLAVLFGAKYVFNNIAKAPVTVSPVESKEADSPACHSFIDALPDKVMDKPRAEIAEPVPPGVAAWAATSEDKVTVRCGVDMPFQYTEYSQTQDVEGEKWYQVRDATPGSDLTTWYAAQRFPIAAVTASTDATPGELNEALSALEEKPATPHKAPLKELKRGNDQMCAEVEKALPESVAEGYRRREAAEKNTYVWSANGREDIVARCGVAKPENYRAGVKLQQVNDIPWFEDTTLAHGTTAGTWFALGREDYLALHAPQEAAQAALVEIGDVLAKHTAEK